MKESRLTQADLKQVMDLHYRIRRDREQLNKLEELASGVGSFATDNVKVQSSPANSNGFAAAAADIDRLLDQEETELEYLCAKVESFMSTIDDTYKAQVIQYRYIEGLPWELVADLTNYTIRHVYRIHDSLIETLPEE